MTTIGKRRPVRLSALSCKAEKRASNPVTSPPGTEYFDIVSPPPGDREVVSQVERLSSSETKIAPRLVWIAVWSSGRGSAAGTVASRVMGSATSLCLGADRYPPQWYLYPLRHGDLPRRCAGDSPQARPALPAGERHLDRPVSRRKGQAGAASGRGPLGRRAPAGLRERQHGRVFDGDRRCTGRGGSRFLCGAWIRAVTRLPAARAPDAASRRER